MTDAAATATPNASKLWSPTVQVILAVLIWVLVLALFQHVPTALRWPVRIMWFGLSFWLLWTAIQTFRSTVFTMKKVVFILVLCGFYYVGLSFACKVFVKIMSQRDDRLSSRSMTALPEPCKEGINALIKDDRYNLFSKEIGWVPRPGYINTAVGYTVNKQGVRGTKEYPVPAPNVEKRILCLGDSFTFGVAVRDDESYPAHAEKLVPGSEWINLGIPGACLVQSYQRYLRDSPTFGGKRVVVGFMTNDAQRTVNAFRPFVNADSGCPFTKPFAKYEKGKFSVEPNPYSSLSDFKNLLANEATELPKLAKLDYLTWSAQGKDMGNGPISRTFFYVWEAYRLDRNLQSLLDNNKSVSSLISGLMPADPYGRGIWAKDSPGFKAVAKMFEHYRDKIIADGREPLFVIIPGPLDVDDYVKGFPCQYTSLIEHFKAHNVPHIDFLPTLIAKHKNNLQTDAIFVRLHYRSPVNKELAEEIIKTLKLK